MLVTQDPIRTSAGETTAAFWNRVVASDARRVTAVEPVQVRALSWGDDMQTMAIARRFVHIVEVLVHDRH